MRINMLPIRWLVPTVLVVVSAFFSLLRQLPHLLPLSMILTCTHVTDLLVARLRVWDQLRSMLAVNSMLLSDDPGLKNFNAQE